MKARKIKIDEINICEVLNQAANGDKKQFNLLVEKFNKNIKWHTLTK